MDASTVHVPPKVAALAARQQLGMPVAGHKGTHPVVECLTGLVIAGVIFGVAAGVYWVGQYIMVKPLAMLFLILVLAGLAATGYAFYLLFRPYVVVYHFEHGLVWTRNRRTEAAQFSWVDEMYVTRKDAKATAAGLVTLDGRELDITGADKADYTAFVDRLEAVLVARRRLVRTERRRPTGRGAAGIGLSDRALAVMAVIGGGALVAAIAVPLSKVGLPGPVAAIIGFLVIGIGIGLIGARVDGRIAVIGGIFAAVAGIVAMVTVARAVPSVNKYVTATVVLAVEMGIVSVVVGLYQRLPALPPTRARKKLAARHGWEFLPALAVAVPGPVSAQRLIGVQEGAPSMQLHDVLRGTVNGVPVLVGDRQRRRPRRSDPVQTVWMVPLPAPVPYFPHTALTPPGQGQGDALADDLLRAFADQAAGRPFGITPPWWMEGSFLLCEGPGDPETIASWVNALTRIVAQMPWDTVRARIAGSPSA
ncbi:hypothetical protein Daura_47170 [Dactylosporangium aurantiacum]|uniref:Uncharacterized protein n=1 Tax=Dactylosporangium aurantiacum TaxID=35754 RepID=A0A9Q9IDE8_9ACTN|nr:hypothetical protein [Dactylosporangium aurantiacum]MDG6105478.1 hypothetical protein [Dactylosporangium aurantiacum]UWZ53987.1 hypothetical protein Daura_47170 [Dactylosporangium aurantiacum]